MVPLRLSFAPSRSMYSAGGDDARLSKVARVEARSLVLAMNFTGAMILFCCYAFPCHGLSPHVIHSKREHLAASRRNAATVVKTANVMGDLSRV